MGVMTKKRTADAVLAMVPTSMVHIGGAHATFLICASFSFEVLAARPMNISLPIA